MLIPASVVSAVPDSSTVINVFSATVVTVFVIVAVVLLLLNVTTIPVIPSNFTLITHSFVAIIWQYALVLVGSKVKFLFAVVAKITG